MLDIQVLRIKENLAGQVVSTTKVVRWDVWTVFREGIVLDNDLHMKEAVDYSSK